MPFEFPFSGVSIGLVWTLTISKGPCVERLVPSLRWLFGGTGEVGLNRRKLGLGLCP